MISFKVNGTRQEVEPAFASAGEALALVPVERAIQRASREVTGP